MQLITRPKPGALDTGAKRAAARFQAKLIANGSIPATPETRQNRRFFATKAAKGAAASKFGVGGRGRWREMFR